MIWFDETSPYEPNQRLQVTELIYRAKTEQQDLVIFDNPAFGRVLALDGLIQTTERDEFIYHEMLVHVPCLAHGAVRHVLIIGGGDGGALRVALEHPIERATLVELDPTVIELSREYLPTICGAAFDDPRAEVVIADGSRFVADTDARFDLILIDSTDPVGPAATLFSEQFYASCKRCLREDGIVITQSGIPFVQPDSFHETSENLSAQFGDVAFYWASVPSYGGSLAFGWASDQPGHRDVPLQTLRDRHRAAGITSRYYNPELHHAAFALPTYVQSLLGS